MYTTAETWESWDEYDARPKAAIRAVHMTTSRAHAFSHDSAALLHGLPLIRPQDSDIHLTRPNVRASSCRDGLHQHGARVILPELGTVEGLPVLSRARTVADIARLHGYRAGLVAADGAMQAGVTRDEMLAVAERMDQWPHVTVVRAAIADADPGAESVAESLARELLMEAGLGPIETQFPAPRGRGVAWCDIRVGCHVFEVHGDIKLQSVSEGGLLAEGRSALDAVREQRRREREIIGPNPLGLSLLYWADFWGRARSEAIKRVQEEHALTVRTFGTRLSEELERFAAEHRGRRYKAS